MTVVVGMVSRLVCVFDIFFVIFIRSIPQVLLQDSKRTKKAPGRQRGYLAKEQE